MQSQSSVESRWITKNQICVLQKYNTWFVKLSWHDFLLSFFCIKLISKKEYHLSERCPSVRPSDIDNFGIHLENWEWNRDFVLFVSPSFHFYEANDERERMYSPPFPTLIELNIISYPLFYYHRTEPNQRKKEMEW